MIRLNLFCTLLHNSDAIKYLSLYFSSHFWISSLLFLGLQDSDDEDIEGDIDQQIESMLAPKRIVKEIKAPIDGSSIPGLTSSQTASMIFFECITHFYYLYMAVNWEKIFKVFRLKKLHKVRCVRVR